MTITWVWTVFLFCYGANPDMPPSVIYDHPANKKILNAEIDAFKRGCPNSVVEISSVDNSTMYK